VQLLRELDQLGHLVLVDQLAQLLGARRATSGEQTGQSVVDLAAPVDVLGGRE
jgi:hypothetical protein